MKSTTFDRFNFDKRLTPVRRPLNGPLRINTTPSKIPLELWRVVFAFGTKYKKPFLSSWDPRKMKSATSWSCKNQIFMLFIIECVCKWILVGFLGLAGINFGFQLAFTDDFESKCYKLCERGRGQINYVPPSPSLKTSFWSPRVRGKQGELRRPIIPLTGSAVLFQRFS